MSELLCTAIAIMGPPGAGKTTHTRSLAEFPGTILLRGRDIKPDSVEVYEPARLLIPDEEFVPALKSRLGDLSIYGKCVILDNIPRTPEQADTLLDWLNTHGSRLAVIELDINEYEVWDRLVNRRYCESCGQAYHPKVNPTRSPGICDKDAAQLVKRVGDREELVGGSYKRYLGVLREVVPVLENGGAMVRRIDASGTLEDTWHILTEQVLVPFFPELIQPRQYASI